MKTVTESIFDGDTTVIPMADVSHIEKHWYPTDIKRTKDNYRGIIVVSKHTKWNIENDTWENNAYLSKDEAKEFLKFWCVYRCELEKSTIKEI